MESIKMESGKVFSKEKIDEFVGYIVEKFAEEKLSVDEAKVILYSTEKIIGECSQVLNYKHEKY